MEASGAPAIVHLVAAYVVVSLALAGYVLHLRRRRKRLLDLLVQARRHVSE